MNHDAVLVEGKQAILLAHPHFPGVWVESKTCDGAREPDSQGRIAEACEL